MALVKLDAGVDPFRTSRDGMVFYSRAGRMQVRTKVKPIFPASPAQLVNINGIAMASRAWRNTLTGPQIASWYTPCFWGWPGSPWMQAIWSIIMWIWRGLPPYTWTGTCPPPICVASFVLNVGTGSLLVTLESGSDPDARGYLSVTPPMSAGRVPQLDDSRILAIGISAGTTIEVGPAYIARFGSLPTVGSIGFGTRFANINTGAATAICFVIDPEAHGDCSWTDPTVIPGTYGSTAGNGLATFAAGGLLDPISAVCADTSLSLDLFSTIYNDTAFVANLRDVGGTPRTGTTYIRYTLIATGDICDAYFDFEVQSGGP